MHTDQDEQATCAAVRASYVDALAAIEWDVFASFTFADPRVVLTLARAWKEFRRWLRRVQRLVGHPVTWYACPELQGRGSIHLHVLLAGVPESLLPEIEAAWQGDADVQPYDQSQDHAARLYVTKEIVQGAEPRWGGPGFPGRGPGSRRAAGKPTKDAGPCLVIRLRPPEREIVEAAFAEARRWALRRGRGEYDAYDEAMDAMPDMFATRPRPRRRAAPPFALLDPRRAWFLDVICQDYLAEPLDARGIAEVCLRRIGTRCGASGIEEAIERLRASSARLAGGPAYELRIPLSKDAAPGSRAGTIASALSTAERKLPASGTGMSLAWMSLGFLASRARRERIAGRSAGEFLLGHLAGLLRVGGRRRRRPRAAAGRAPRPCPDNAVVVHRARVHPDCHVVYDRSLYSAPHRLIGTVLIVVSAHDRVELYDGPDLVASHPPASAPRQRVTDRSHYPPRDVADAMTAPVRLRRRALALGPSVAAVVDCILGEHPLERLRAAQGLVGLARRHGAVVLDATCLGALVDGEVSYRAVAARLRAIARSGPVVAVTDEGDVR